MLIKKAIPKVFIFLFLIFSFQLIAKESSNDKILAEFDGGTITKNQLDDRISKISPMIQARYKTQEGQKNLLNMMCTEEVFYKEALLMGVDKDEDVIDKIETYLKSTYYQEYKKNEIKPKITFTHKEKQDYFIENNKKFPGKTFDESEKQIEMALRPQKEKELTEKIKNDLFKKYNIEIVNDVLDSIKLDDIENNKQIENEIIVKSSKPEIEKTVADFISFYKQLDPRQKSMAKKGLLDFVNHLLEIDVFYFEALDKDYDKKESIIEISNQMKRNVILRTIYNRLVIDKLPTTDKELKKYYNKNIEKFSSLASRKIQAFAFKDEATAKKILKKVKKAKKNDKLILKLLKENSLHPENDGIKDNIYKNDIIPGIGKDKVYCDMVWKTSPKKISKIFKNSKDEYVFFKILEDKLPVAEPFEKIKDRVKNSVIKKYSKKKFEDVTANLETKYHMKKYLDNLITQLTAEEYFNKAEESQKGKRFKDAMFYYDQVIKYYKNNKDDYKALFMKAFIYSEDLNDKEKAKKIFAKVIKDYPEGDLHESARFMIKELNGKSDIFKKIESNK